MYKHTLRHAHPSFKFKSALLLTRREYLCANISAAGPKEHFKGVDSKVNAPSATTFHQSLPAWLLLPQVGTCQEQ